MPQPQVSKLKQKLQTICLLKFRVKVEVHDVCKNVSRTILEFMQCDRVQIEEFDADDNTYTFSIMINYVKEMDQHKITYVFCESITSR